MRKKTERKYAKTEFEQSTKDNSWLSCSCFPSLFLNKQQQIVKRNRAVTCETSANLKLKLTERAKKTVKKKTCLN